MPDADDEATRLEARARVFARAIKWVFVPAGLAVASPLVFGTSRHDGVGIYVDAYLLLITPIATCLLVGTWHHLENKAVRVRAFTDEPSRSTPPTPEDGDMLPRPANAHDG